MASDTLDAYWNLAFPDPQLRGVYPPRIAESVAPYLKPDDLKAINRPVDWFGLNHYSPHYVAATTTIRSGMGFGSAPEMCRAPRWGGRSSRMHSAKFCTSMHERYGLPIYVTENGTAYADRPAPDGKVSDEPRISYLKAYTARCSRRSRPALTCAAISSGRCWIISNGASGYSQRFGLVYVDYPTQRRLPKELIPLVRRPDQGAFGGGGSDCLTRSIASSSTATRPVAERHSERR